MTEKSVRDALELFNAAKSVAAEISRRDCTLDFVFCVFVEDAEHEEVATGLPVITFKTVVPLHESSVREIPTPALIQHRSRFYSRRPESWRCELTVSLVDDDESKQYVFHSGNPPRVVSPGVLEIEIFDTVWQDRTACAPAPPSWTVWLHVGERNVIKALSFTNDPDVHSDLVHALSAADEKGKISFALGLLKIEAEASRKRSRADI